VAEDHQTRNALSLTDQDAACMISDKEARGKLRGLVAELLSDPTRMESIAMKAHMLARPEATQTIVNHVIEIAKK
jgi:UDP-N-acetylglucosamine--N-acetylmuramyl-(pentapeptide) pyrophosphoryl-undecaprenol N-acetylglucosamine transferase